MDFQTSLNRIEELFRIMYLGLWVRCAEWAGGPPPRPGGSVGDKPVKVFAIKVNISTEYQSAQHKVKNVQSD